MVMNVPDKREFYNANAAEEFENCKERILEKLYDLQEEILIFYGFYFNFEDIYLRHPDEMVITIY